MLQKIFLKISHYFFGNIKIVYIFAVYYYTITLIEKDIKA